MEMERLREIVLDADTPAGRRFDRGVQILIVISLAAFTIDTLPNLEPQTRAYLGYIEVTSLMLFTMEYLLRLYVSPDRFKFATSFFGVIDLIAILPFFIYSGVDLRPLRILRILKLFRHSKALLRFQKAVVIAKDEFVLFFFTTVMMMYMAAVGIYYFENAAQPDVFKSVFHSLWWAVITLTTVGYGDIYPITAGGRVFTFAILLIGLGIVAIPAGLVSSALSTARELEEQERLTNEDANTAPPKPPS